MASSKLEEIYAYLDKDPHRVPYTGDKRKQIIMQLAQQEYKQQKNNQRAFALLIDKAAPSQRTTGGTDGLGKDKKEVQKPVKAHRDERFDLDVVQEFVLNDLQWGQPSNRQLKKIARPIKTMELAVEDLALPPVPDNDSPETYAELLEAQEMAMLRDEDRLGSIQAQARKNGIVEAFKEYSDANDLRTNWDFVRMVIDDVQTLCLNLKFAFNRPRPATLAQHLGIVLNPHGDYAENSPSYPSFHSTVGRVVAEVIAGAYVGHRSRLIALGDTIGMNRVIGGYHFLTDHQAGINLANQLVLKIPQNLSITPVYEPEITIGEGKNFMDEIEEMHRRMEVKKEANGEDDYMEAIRAAMAQHREEHAHITDVELRKATGAERNDILENNDAMRESFEYLEYQLKREKKGTPKYKKVKEELDKFYESLDQLHDDMQSIPTPVMSGEEMENTKAGVKPRGSLDKVDNAQKVHPNKRFSVPLRIIHPDTKQPYTNSTGMYGVTNESELAQKSGGEGREREFDPAKGIEQIQTWLNSIPEDRFMPGKLLAPLYPKYDEGENSDTYFPIKDVFQQYLDEDMAAQPATSASGFLSEFGRFVSESSEQTPLDFIDFLGEFSPTVQLGYHDTGEDERSTYRAMKSADRVDKGWEQLAKQQKEAKADRKQELTDRHARWRNDWSSNSTEWRREMFKSWIHGIRPGMPNKADMFRSFTDSQKETLRRMVGTHETTTADGMQAQVGNDGKNFRLNHDLAFAALYVGLGFTKRAKGGLANFLSEPGSLDALINNPDQHTSPQFIAPFFRQRIEELRNFRDGLSKDDRKKWDSLGFADDKRFANRRAEWLKQALIHPEGGFGAMRRVYQQYKNINDLTNPYRDAEDNIDDLKAEALQDINNLPYRGIGQSAPDPTKTGFVLQDEFQKDLAKIKEAGLARDNGEFGADHQGAIDMISRKFEDLRTDLLGRARANPDQWDEAYVDDSFRAITQMATKDLMGTMHALQMDNTAPHDLDRFNWFAVPEKYRLFNDKKAAMTFGKAYEEAPASARAAIRNHASTGSIVDADKFLDSVNQKHSEEQEGYRQEVMSRQVGVAGMRYGVYDTEEPIEYDGKGNIVTPEGTFHADVIKAISQPDPDMYASAQNEDVFEYLEDDAIASRSMEAFSGIEDKSRDAIIKKIGELEPDARSKAVEEIFAVIAEDKQPIITTQGGEVTVSSGRIKGTPAQKRYKKTHTAKLVGRIIDSNPDDPNTEENWATLQKFNVALGDEEWHTKYADKVQGEKNRVIDETIAEHDISKHRDFNLHGENLRRNLQSLWSEDGHQVGDRRWKMSDFTKKDFNTGERPSPKQVMGRFLDQQQAGLPEYNKPEAPASTTPDQGTSEIG